MRRFSLLTVFIGFWTFTIAQNSALEYFEEARQLYKEKNYGEALLAFDKAMQMNPDYSWAIHKMKAQIKEELGDYVGAVYEYNRALEFNIEDAESYVLRGKAKFDYGDEQGAYDDFNKAISLNPSYGMAYFERGMVKGSQGNKKASCEDWRKAVELGYSEASKCIRSFCN